jgi:hypothetical protein
MAELCRAEINISPEELQGIIRAGFQVEHCVEVIVQYQRRNRAQYSDDCLRQRQRYLHEEARIAAAVNLRGLQKLNRQLVTKKVLAIMTLLILTAMGKIRAHME